MEVTLIKVRLILDKASEREVLNAIDRIQASVANLRVAITPVDLTKTFQAVERGAKQIEMTFAATAERIGLRLANSIMDALERVRGVISVTAPFGLGMGVRLPVPPTGIGYTPPPAPTAAPAFPYALPPYYPPPALPYYLPSALPRGRAPLMLPYLQPYYLPPYYVPPSLPGYVPPALPPVMPPYLRYSALPAGQPAPALPSPEQVTIAVRSLEALRAEINAQAAAASRATEPLRTLEQYLAGLGASVTQYSRFIREALSALNLRPQAETINLAARMVARGQLTLGQAVQAIYAGLTRTSEVMAKAGSSARLTAAEMGRLASAMARAARAVGAPETARIPTPEEMLIRTPEQQQLALAAMTRGLTEAGKASGGLMQSLRALAEGGVGETLLQLRWELFTIMFFVIGAKQAFSALVWQLSEGARVADSAAVSFRLLRLQGMVPEDVIRSISEASDGYLAYSEAAQLAAMATIQFAGDPRLIRALPDLARIAGAVAAATGQQADQVMNALITSIGRGQTAMATSTRLLHHNMRTLLTEYQNARAAGDYLVEGYEWIADALADVRGESQATVASMTAEQRQALVLWGILRHGGAVLEDLGEDYNKLTSATYHLKSGWQTLVQTVQVAIASVLAPAAEFLGELLRQIAALLVVFIKFRSDLRGYAGVVGEMAAAVARGVAEGETPLRKFGNAMDYLAEALHKILLRFLTGRTDIEELGVEGSSAISQLNRGLEDTGEAAELAQNTLRQLLDALLQYQQSYMELQLRWQREEEDRTRRWAREEEDLQRELARRLEDLDEEQRKRDADREKRYRDRVLEAERDLARRLAEIEADLARRLADIWRSYYEEMWEAIAERDATAAIRAMRRRDAAIQRALEEAELQRQQAWNRYWDIIEDAQRALDEERRREEESYAERLEELNKWLQRRREDMEIARQRELEDAAIARARELQDLEAHLQYQLALITINNNAQLTEYERYFALLEALKASYQSRLQQPIVIPVVFQYLPQEYQPPPPPPPLPTETVPGWRDVGAGAIPRAHGGVDIVTRPTLFLVGEAGPELMITRPLYGAAPQSPIRALVHHEVNAIVRSAIAGTQGRLEGAVRRVIEEVLR